MTRRVAGDSAWTAELSGGCGQELGEHPKVVQERLGHSTISTTMNIYSHVTPTMQKAAVNRFAAHLGDS